MAIRAVETEDVEVKGGRRELDIVMTMLTDVGLDPRQCSTVVIEPAQHDGKPGVTFTVTRRKRT